MSDLRPILARTPVGHIEDVVERLREIEAVMPPQDGVACFNHLYRVTTENLVRAIDRGLFGDARFMRELDVVFANLYFAALSAPEVGAAPPPAWRPLFDARTDKRVAPLQFALAGMNAHINRDLPKALVEAFGALGLELTRPNQQSRDYDEFNEVLAATEAEVRTAYFTPLLRALDGELHGVDDVAANFCIRTAREAAWTNATALWHLRGHPTVAGEYFAMLDRTVGFAGRGLLVETLRAA